MRATVVPATRLVIACAALMAAGLGIAGIMVDRRDDAPSEPAETGTCVNEPSPRATGAGADEEEPQTYVAVCRQPLEVDELPVTPYFPTDDTDTEAELPED